MQFSKRVWAKGLSLTAFILCFSLSLFSQANNDNVQMADGMRSSGKIYVVVAVLLTVLAGLILYIVRLDKKITRLEKQAND